MIKCITKKKHLAIAAVAVAAILIIALLIISIKKQEETTYRETTVLLGDLVVGITENSSVDIGTVAQTFELDMSALQRANTGSAASGTANSSGNGSSVASGGGNPSGAMGNMGSGSTGQSSNAGGGLSMFDQLVGMAEGGNNNSSASEYSLGIEQVLVTAGQKVKEGDVLYLLEEDSVSRLEEELSANVEKAKADLDAVYADQQLSQNTAQYNYDSSNAYGSYASAEYESTIQQLQQEVESCQQNLDKANSSLQEYGAQLSQVISDYEEALKLLEQCEWGRDNTDKWNNTYEYAANFQLAQKAQSNADILEQKKGQIEQKAEQASQNVETLTKALNSANRNLTQGKLTAQETMSLRELAYSTSQETYDLALEYLKMDAGNQEEVYEEAQGKWEEFSSHIKENAVCAGYSGVITSVELAKGDSIQTGDTLVTMYNMDEVTMTATVSQEDMTDITEGAQANLNFTAYPDQIFKADVTEISDASTDTGGNVVYEVTVTLQGDVSGLFQGMTGSVTFITKETREVLYVSNRAILREGTRSYVKVMDAEGNIRKQVVKTGFSDGINVEIQEGLSEGEIVLIESKVSEA